MGIGGSESVVDSREKLTGSDAEVGDGCAACSFSDCSHVCSSSGSSLVSDKADSSPIGIGAVNSFEESTSSDDVGLAVAISDPSELHMGSESSNGSDG